VRESANQRRAAAKLQQELRSVGVEVDDAPLAEVALGLVRVWRGTELFLRQRVQELDQMLAGPHGEDILAVLGGGGKEGREIAAKAPQAIAGRTDPGNWKADRHVLYAMWEDASDRVMRYVKQCRDAGIEEARLELEQEKVRQLAEVISGTLRAVLALVLDVVRSSGATAAEGAVREAWTREVPGIVRAQIEAHDFAGVAA
jgi:hypothetical protein